MTNIEIVVQSEKNNAYSDLAAGAGGTYRYLKMLRDSSQTRIKKVGLLRSRKYLKGNWTQYNWDECTQDINSGRKGDYLHLCWNTVSV